MMTSQQLEILAFNSELIPSSVKRGMSNAGAKSRDNFQVPIDKLKVMPGFNPRVKDDAYHARVRGHADSMKIHGFFQDKPLAVVVTEDGIWVVEGGTRLDAANLAVSEGALLEFLPCCAKDGSSIEDLTVALVRGNEGERFSLWEMAVVVKRLHAYGWDDAKIAANLGISLKQIDNFRKIVTAPLEVRKMMEKGSISALMAIETVAKHGKDAVKILKVALAKAKADGKDKMSPKHMPGQARASHMKKTAPTIYGFLYDLSKDQSFAILPAEFQEKLQKFLKDVPSLDLLEGEAAADSEVKGSAELSVV